MTQSSHFRNAITIDADFTVGSIDFTANSSYSILFSAAGDSMALLPLTLGTDANSNVTAALDTNGVILSGIDPVAFASNFSDVSTVDAGFIGHNVINVSGFTQFTSSSSTVHDVGAGYWAVLPSPNGWALHQLALDDNNDLFLKEGGDVVDGFTTADIFTAGLSSNSSISDVNSTITPPFSTGVDYKLVAHYDQTTTDMGGGAGLNGSGQKVADGVSYKVYQLTTDILGNVTSYELSAQEMQTEGITVQASEYISGQEGPAIADVDAFFNDAGNSGKYIKFSMSKTEGNETYSWGYNTIEVNSTPNAYEIRADSHFRDDPFTAGDESSGVLVTVIDNFTGDEPTSMTDIGMKLNVYNSDLSGSAITGTNDFVPGGQDVTDTSVMFYTKDYTGANMYMSLVANGESDYTITKFTNDAGKLSNFFKKHEDGADAGTPKGVGELLSNGTKGVTDDDVVVGSSKGNIFNLDDGTTSDYSEATFNDGMDGEAVGFDFTGTDYTDDLGESDYVAFGNDGDDFAIGINDGDVFIGGKGHDTAVFDGEFQDYTFNIATNEQFNIAVIGNGVDLVIDDNSYLTSADKNQIVDTLVDTGPEIWSISTGGNNGTMSFVQSEEMFFAGDPGLSLSSADVLSVGTKLTDVMIDELDAAGVNVSSLNAGDTATEAHSLALGKAELTEKTSDSDDFQIHTIELDVGESGEGGYDAAQTLFWEIEAKGGDGQASLDDFVETSGYVDVAAGQETASIDLKVVNDGDQDEISENFALKIGYVIGDNEVTTLDFDTTVHDGEINMTDNAVGEVDGPAGNPYMALKAEGGDDVDITGATDTIVVTSTDTAGNTMDLTTLAADGKISASDLAFAAAKGNVFLAQETISATIASDPVEYYVYSGHNMRFSGTDFTGAKFVKEVSKSEDASITFNTIAEAMNAAASNDSLTEIRISNDHHESEDITITVDNLLIDFWSTEAMAGPVVQTEAPEILEVSSADVGALATALGPNAPALVAGDKISFTDDGKMLIVDANGDLVGNPVVLTDAQKTNLQSFEERAELQGKVDTTEIIALTTDDVTAINTTLGLTGGEELGAGEKVTFSEDGKTILVVNDQGDMVRPPIELSDQEATQLEAYADQAELQGEVNTDAIIDLDESDAAALNSTLGLTGGVALGAGEKVTFSEDGKTLMLVNDQGKVIAPPVTLSEAQQAEIGAYADKASIQGDLRPEDIVVLNAGDATAISGVLNLTGGDALADGEKVAFNDDGTQMVVVGDSGEIVGGPITLTTGQVAFMKNYAEKAELQVKAAELEGDIQKEEIITIDATDASAVNNVLGLTGGDALAADTKITFSEDGETMLIVNDAGEVLGDPIVLDQAKQNALNDYAERAEQQGSLNQDEVITVSSSDATAINQALQLTGADVIAENDTITITDDGKMLVVDQYGDLVGNPIPLNETQKTALASIEAKVNTQGKVAELEGDIQKEEIITIDATDASAVNNALGLTGGDALAADTKITFSEDGETMLIVNDAGEVLGDPIVLDQAKQNALNDYAERAELQGSLEDNDAITLDSTDAAEVSSALGLTGGDAIGANTKVTFSDDGTEMFILDGTGKVVGAPIILDESKQNAISEYADKAEIQSTLNEAEVVKIDATDAAVLNAVIDVGLSENDNIAFNADGTQMVILDDQGKVLGKPIDLDETAQLALGQYADKAEAQGDIHADGIIQLGGAEVAEINTALGLSGGEALAANTKVTFTDDGKLILLDGSDKMIGNPIELDETEKAELSGYIERRDTALEMAGVPTGDPMHVHHGVGTGDPHAKATGPLVFKLGAGIKNVYFGGDRDINVYGNELDNIIVGNHGNNKIFGKKGSDVLLGYGGDDVIKGGSGNDFVDGMEGADRVYGQRGDDTLVATGSTDGEFDEEAQDLLSGGSGADTLIDAANKTGQGQTSLLGGSGADTFSIGVMHHDLDFTTGSPVDTWDHSDRNVDTHLADLTSSDSLDFLALMEIAPAAGSTAIAMDIDGDGNGTGTRISLDSSGSVASIDLSSGEGEVSTLLSVAEGLAIDASDLVDWAVGDIITDDMLAQMIAGGAPAATTDAITAGTTTIAQTHIDLMDEAAPMLNLSGQIGISHATEATIVAALTTETVKSAETAFGSADSGGAMDHYGITDDLTWVSEV